MPHRYWNSRAIWDHTVLSATRQRWRLDFLKGPPRIFNSHFLTENEIENGTFLMPASSVPYFSQKMGCNVKPCLRYNLTGIWFYCASKQHTAATFYHIIFCNQNNGVFTAKKIMTKTGQEIASYYWVSCKTPTKNSVEECSLKILVSIVKMDIVESCELTASVAPSAGWNYSGEK